MTVVKKKLIEEAQHVAVVRQAAVTRDLCFHAEAVRKEMTKWLPKLSPLVDRMSKRIDPSGIQLTAASFGIARSFPKRHATNRSADFEMVVSPLEAAVDGLSEINLVDRVNQLADKLALIPELVTRRHNKPIRPISAASKFIWTARPCIGIIYDYRAWHCVGRLYSDSRRGEYGAFVNAVRMEQVKHTLFIDELIPHAGPQLSQAPWIKGKIFDFCLYAHGGRRKNRKFS